MAKKPSATGNQPPEKRPAAAPVVGDETERDDKEILDAIAKAGSDAPRAKTSGKKGAQAAISVDNLNVTYFPGRSNEVRALKGISLDIMPGEYIIFFGPSGCGKSTLLYSLAGLERNVTGNIVVNGKDLSSMTQGQLEEYHQTTIGMIFQSYYLIASLAVAQNVALPKVAVSAGKAERLKRAVELLEKFGVGAQAWKLPMELSGGQQQRVAICRALINEPGILVADEPVGNLDSKSTKDVMDVLRYLHDEQGKTVILVTHDPSHLFHANRIYYLRDGVITGTKTNTEEERKQSAVQPGAGNPAALAASLTHWVRTLAPSAATVKGKPDQGAVGRQTQEILAEALTGLSVDELLEIEEKLHAILQGKAQGHQTIYGFLRKAVKRGGVGMDKRRAKRLADEMQGIARSIRSLTKKGASAKKPAKPEDAVLLEVRDIRRSLLDHTDVQVKDLEAVAALDTIVRDRLEGKIDRYAAQKALCRGPQKGGLGLRPRTARRMAQLMETFIVYKPETGPAQIPTSAPNAPPPDPPPSANAHR